MKRGASRTSLLAVRVFGPAGLLATVPLCVFILVEDFLLKRAMLVKADSLLSELDTFRAMRGDVLLFGIGCIVFAVLISASRGALRACLVGLFSVVMFLSGLYLVANYFYYESTGEGLSRTVLSYGIRNIGENSSLLASEARPLRLALLGLQFLMFVGALLLPRLKGVKKWIERAERSGRGQIIAAYLAGVIALEAYTFVPPLSDVHPAVEPLAMGGGLLGAGGAGERVPPGFSVPEDERLDRPLSLEKDPAVPELNIVLIIFESLNWKNSDLFTPGKGTTPFLADLGRRGAVVDHIYTVVPHTTKALIPILCGTYPYLEPEVKEAVPGILPQKGLAHLLRKAGYATAFFQTANNYESRSQVVANMGFEDFAGVYDMPAEGFSDTNYYGKEERMMLRPSLDWVDARRGRPFFLTYLTLCPHHNYETPRDWTPIDFGVADPIENKYLNAVRYTDEFVKEVMAAFEERGLTQDTLFVVSSDHGEAFGEHKEQGHNMTLFEEVLRTICILYAPGRIAPGTVIQGTRSILDLAPTVCDFLGLRVKEGSFVGESLLRSVPADRKLYFSAWSSRWELAVRLGPVKTILWPVKQKFAVFDNATDAFDERDLADRAGHDAGKLALAGAELNNWADGVNAQYLEWEKAAKKGTSATLPSMKNVVHGTFGGLISLAGYEAYPTEIPRQRSIYLKLALRAEGRILRPLRLAIRLAHLNGRAMRWTVPVPALDHYEKLEPGDYFLAETFLLIPSDWPTGETGLEAAVLDRRSGRTLPLTDEETPAGDTGGWVRLSPLRIIE
jgi:lipoteichoic acid synthase